MSEAIEMCPHCEAENSYLSWNIQTQGYIATCKNCNKQIFLCDECMHSEDNPTMSCNWHVEGNENVCMRGRMKEN